MASHPWTRGPESRPVLYLLLVQSFFNSRKVSPIFHANCSWYLERYLGPLYTRSSKAHDHPNRKSMSEEKDGQSISSFSTKLEGLRD
jgi:hypothetical protein